MKFRSLGLIGFVCAGAAFAASESPMSTAPIAAQAARPLSMFAAASAPFARRLTPEQREEWRFLKDAAAMSRFEADASRMALAKASDANVRALAATLVNHHSSAQSALQRMLHARNMAPPMLSNDQRKALNRMGKLQGVKFERQWVEWVALRSQQDSLAQYEHAASAARDPQLLAWIERTLPEMRFQFQAAERIVTGGVKFAKLAPLLPPAAAATTNLVVRPALNPAD